MRLPFLPTPVCSAALGLIALQVARSAFHTSSLPVIPAIQAGAADTRDGVILLAARAAASCFLPPPLASSLSEPALHRPQYHRSTRETGCKRYSRQGGKPLFKWMGRCRVRRPRPPHGGGWKRVWMCTLDGVLSPPPGCAVKNDPAPSSDLRIAYSSGSGSVAGQDRGGKPPRQTNSSLCVYPPDCVVHVLYPFPSCVPGPAARLPIFHLVCGALSAQPVYALEWTWRTS
ncbi:hypothetical protein DFH08DRAFT_985058 [Mycena albidolilacea]|uniref:Secreted protein n=1 Tax=Mycena albidolilacea TaxID=1033008 RepID=A0AAD7ACS9_9AGAR|nr:hypothetical protein DFH08DRAFT_985058 [Mycena albidolilacea]